jgi:hypothetical protein
MTPDLALTHNRWEPFAMVDVALNLVDEKELYPMRSTSRDKHAWSNTVHTYRHLALL